MDNNIHTEVSIQEKQGSSSMLIGEGYDLGDPRNIPGFKQTTNFTPQYSTNKIEKKKGTHLSAFCFGLICYYALPLQPRTLTILCLTIFLTASLAGPRYCLGSKCAGLSA